MTHEYTTRGTCSRKILFEVEDGKVHNVQFINGCSGNTQGVAKLGTQRVPATDDAQTHRAPAGTLV